MSPCKRVAQQSWIILQQTRAVSGMAGSGSYEGYYIVAPAKEDGSSKGYRQRLLVVVLGALLLAPLTVHGAEVEDLQVSFTSKLVRPR
jgi:hypothetical protein